MQILAAHGFERVRQRRSHVVMQAKNETSTVTVPVPLHASIRVGTLASIIRQSGVPRHRFEVP